MNRDILERPFPAESIKTRKGPGRTELSYVEGAEVVKRLNDAFEGAWSFRVLDRSQVTMQDRGKERLELVVLGRLEAEGVVHEAFGGAIAGRGECLGDDWKMAATDALKKAASLFGVGLHLWMDESSPSLRSESQNGLLVEVLDEARRRGVEPALRAGCQRRYGRAVEQLAQNELESVLKGMRTKGAAA